MDKHRYFREADTGILEIKKLLDCLVSNGYEFNGTREAVIGRYSYSDEAIADFSKPLEFSDTDGNWINDGSLKVSIQFEKRSDYTNFEKDENEDNIYVGDPEDFINGLVKETQKKLRKKRKSRKKRGSVSSSNTPASI
jgi:hypothetical protein